VARVELKGIYRFDFMGFFTKLRGVLKVMPEQFTQLLQQALQRNTKSTVLKPLGWLVGLLLVATVSASRFGMDEWLVVMLAVLDCLAVILYFIAYIFFGWKDPDLLRSEKFTIQKMAIQHGYIGDDISGFMKITRVGTVPLLEDSKTGEVGKGEK
jgi:hypothetical protein